MTTPITIPPGQAKMARYVVQYFLKNGCCPSTRETQMVFGFASQTAVQTCWNALLKKGIFQKENERQARGVVPVWERIIECAVCLWEDHELNEYYVELDWRHGPQERYTFKLPSIHLVSLSLMQEGRNPDFISINKVPS